MIALWRKEIQTLFSSLIAYAVIVVYLVITGLFVWVFPDTSILKGVQSDLTVFFSISPYLLIFLASAITMRSFSEERREGTIELLLTKPISDFSIVLAKFFSSLTVILLALAFTLVYYYSVYQLGSPIGNIDTGSVIGSYIGLFLLATVFVAIGLTASVLASNQLIALLISAILSYLLYDGFNSLSSLADNNGFGYELIRLGIDYHYFSLSRGALEFSSMVYLLSVTLFFLSICLLVLRSRHWE